MTETALLTRLASRIVNTPLMIHVDKLNAILGAVGHRIGLFAPEKAASPPARAAERKANSTGGGRIAVIPVYDSLVFRTLGLQALSGLTSYEDIRSRFREARDDSTVEGIILDLDSHGGEEAGLFDLVDEIHEARGEKPITAVANEMAYSAAYAIASAADKVYLPRTGGVGSIGVVALHVDQSAYDAQKGFKYTYIYAGSHKIDFSPHAPLSPGTLNRLQAEIDEARELFIDTVARNRGLAASKVRATEALTFTGTHAVDAGLADGIMPFSKALDRIRITSKKGGIFMNQNELKTQLEGLITTPGLDAEAALEELGFVAKPSGEPEPAVDLEAARKEAAETAAAEALGRVRGILDLCALAGMPEMAATLIREDLSVEDARKRILEARAEESSRQEIVSTVSALSTGEVNPLLADARRRAGKDTVEAK